VSELQKKFQRKSVYFPMIPCKPLIFLLLSPLLISSLVATSSKTSDLMPSENGNHWSYVGELETESDVSRVNLRLEVDSSVFVDGKRTQLFQQQMVPSVSAISDDISSVNRKYFQNTEDGWLMFREEYDGKILEYNRSVRVLPESLEIGKSYKYKTRLNPDTGVFGVISYHSVVVGEEVLNIPNGEMTAIKVNQEKRTKIASDEQMDDVTDDITEFISSWFVNGVGLVKQEYSQTNVAGVGTTSLKYNVELVGTNYLPNFLWPEAETTTDGWQFVSWLGYLTDDYFPWIYHSDHGWLYVDAEDTSDLRFWSESLGWWFTSKDLYPTFYSYDLDEWLTFDSESSEVERSFKRSDGSIITASNRGFRFAANVSRPPSPTEVAATEKEGDQVFVDAQGNRYTDSSTGITANPGEKPTVEILYPYDQKLVREDERIIILADAKDTDGMIVSVQLFLNGQLIALLDEPPYQTTFVADGDTESYSIYAIARDNFDNETRSETVVVNADLKEKTPPTVRVDSPMNKSYYALGRRVYVELKAADKDGFVEEVGLLVDGFQVGDTLSSPPYKFDFIPPVLGSYSIGGFAIDDDGQETTSQSISITVNETGTPEISSNFLETRIITPLNGQSFSSGQTIPISVSASDSTSGINRIRIFVNGQQIGNSVQADHYDVKYYPPDGLTGNVTIRVEARNNAFEILESSITVKISSL